MSAGGHEQWGAIPVRAFSDARLSRIDFRVLGVVAYHDRFGRNGMGCTLDFRKLAAKAAVDPSHLARHTKRLQEFGYITVTKSETDRRRRSYSVIYEPSAEIVANGGDYLEEKGAKMGANPAPQEDIVASNGEYCIDIVAIEKSQDIDNKHRSDLKRSCKTNIINQAKLGSRNLEDEAAAPNWAMQGKPDRSDVPRQRELRVFQDVNRKTRNQKRLDAEQRLGNGLVKHDLVEPLDNLFGAERGELLAETKEYQKAIDCEMKRYGNGLKYLQKIATLAKVA